MQMGNNTRRDQRHSTEGHCERVYLLAESAALPGGGQEVDGAPEGVGGRADGRGLLAVDLVRDAPLHVAVDHLDGAAGGVALGLLAVPVVRLEVVLEALLALRRPPGPAAVAVGLVHVEGVARDVLRVAALTLTLTVALVERVVTHVILRALLASEVHHDLGLRPRQRPRRPATGRHLQFRQQGPYSFRG